VSRLLAVWLVLLVALGAPVAGWAQTLAPAEGDVVRVTVQGTKRIEEATVLAAIGLRRGQTLTGDKVRRDLKSVHGTGFFDDVRVDVVPEGSGVAVTFTVVEKPAIRDISLDGNKKIDEEDIREVIDLRVFAVLNEADLRVNVERIRDLYVEKGFFLASVEPVITPVTDEQVDLVFKIEEGRKVV